MDRQQGRLMAVTEIKDINELLEQLNTKSLEEGHYKWTTSPIEPLTVSSGGTGASHPFYGAVPNVTIGGGANVTSPVWTTTTNNTGGYTFANQNIQPNNTVHIRGENADLLINDKSLKTWMEKVEERLNILTPNPEMEAEWDQLHRLGERYRKLEKKCREKADMWKKLKSMPRPDLP
jgi:hypothetical protein